MLDKIKQWVFHRAFIVGFCVAIGLSSPYIFGDDNLAEELAEAFIYKKTGVFIDFTPRSKEEVCTDWESITELSDKYGIHH